MSTGDCSCAVENDNSDTTTTSVSISGDDGAGEVGGRVVAVVGVKLDSRSKELLTWALVKVAQPGDHVVALHVLDPNSGKFMPEGEWVFVFSSVCVKGVLQCGVFFNAVSNFLLFMLWV